MLYKCKLPEPYRTKYNKKILYCEVVKVLENIKPKIYLVKVINLNNKSNIFNKNDLKKLNLLDKIKVFFIKRRNTNEKI